MAQWGSLLILPHSLGSDSSSGQRISLGRGPWGWWGSEQEGKWRCRGAGQCSWETLHGVRSLDGELRLHHAPMQIRSFGSLGCRSSTTGVWHLLRNAPWEGLCFSEGPAVRGCLSWVPFPGSDPNPRQRYWVEVWTSIQEACIPLQYCCHAMWQLHPWPQQFIHKATVTFSPPFWRAPQVRRVR